MSFRRTTIHRRSTIASLALVLIAASAGSAAGVELLPTLSYDLKRDGESVPASDFFASERGDAFVVVSPALPSPTWIALGDQEVRRIPEERLIRRDDGTLLLKEGAELQAAGKLSFEDGMPTFHLEGGRFQIAYPPALVGLQEASALLDYNPEYGRRAGVYEPDPASLERLRRVATATRLRVYFGTWCSLCSRYVPRVMKVMEALGESNLRIEYYGLPEDRDADPEPARMKLQGVPTVVVFQGDEEIGRFLMPEKWERPEESLEAILIGPASRRQPPS